MYIPSRILTSFLASAICLSITSKTNATKTDRLLHSHSQQSDSNSNSNLDSIPIPTQLQRQTRSRIVNGTIAPRNQYPWFTALDFVGCGASLITPEWILTAAHCTTENIIPPWFEGEVRVNAYCGFDEFGFGGDCTENEDDEGNGVEVIGFSYDGLFNHPKYTGRVVDGYDLALIHLDSPSSHVPVDIDMGTLSPSYEDGKSLWAIGLGALSADGLLADELMHVEVSYVNNDDCDEAYLTGAIAEYYQIDDDIITDTMMCAAETNKDACQGDSGGPLYDAENGILVGVTSWGEGCAQAPFSGVYARIAEEIEWIKQVVCFNSDDESMLPTWCRGLTKEPSESPTPSPTRGHCEDLFFRLNLTTDLFPQDTTWEVTNSAEEVVLTSLDEEPIDLPHTKYTFYGCLDKNECYNLNINDSFGDGLTVHDAVNPNTPGYSVYVSTESGLDMIASYDGSAFSTKTVSFGNCDAITSMDPTVAPTTSSPPSINEKEVLCPGMSIFDFCDCSHDCTANPTFCACEEAVECCGGEVSTLEPTPGPTVPPPEGSFQIMSTFPSSLEWCIETESMEDGANIVIGKCDLDSETQVWTANEYGQIQLHTMPYLCITKAPFGRLTLEYCGSAETSSDSSFIFDAFEDTIMDTDTSDCFTIASHFPEQGDDVILTERDRSLLVQEWMMI